MKKRTESMADHQKHLRAERWTSVGKSRCTYLLRKDNSQNHGNKQTNEEEKKTKQKNQIK